jgi:hypothetical protein
MSSTITTAAIADALSLSVSKLDASRFNWAIFVFCFQNAVEAKGFWSHFNGTASTPMFANAANSHKGILRKECFPASRYAGQVYGHESRQGKSAGFSRRLRVKKEELVQASVAEVQFRTDAKNRNWPNQTDSSVQFRFSSATVIVSSVLGSQLS